jgi:phosphoserine phosphatase
VQRLFDEDDKSYFVVEHCKRTGVNLAQVFAVGDSRSDIPLFRTVGFSVAINASPDAKAAASCDIETRNLTDVLKLVPGLSGHRYY